MRLVISEMARWAAHPTLEHLLDGLFACSPRRHLVLQTISMVKQGQCYETRHNARGTHVVLLPDVKLLPVLIQPKCFLLRYLYQPTKNKYLPASTQVKVTDLPNLLVVQVIASLGERREPKRRPNDESKERYAKQQGMLLEYLVCAWRV